MTAGFIPAHAYCLQKCSLKANFYMTAVSPKTDFYQYLQRQSRKQLRTLLPRRILAPAEDGAKIILQQLLQSVAFIPKALYLKIQHMFLSLVAVRIFYSNVPGPASFLFIVQFVNSQSPRLQAIRKNQQ
jgi:hypothetical protein